MLLTRDDLATLLTEQDRQVAKLRATLESLEREHEIMSRVGESKCDARVVAETTKHEACLSARVKESAIYEDALKKANDTPFWKSPTLMSILGLGAGAAICAIAK